MSDVSDRMNHRGNQISRRTRFFFFPQTGGCHTAITYWAFNLPTCFANSKEDNENVKAICTLILHRHADVAPCQKMDLIIKRDLKKKLGQKLPNLIFHFIKPNLI